jgi:hypothetical protein
MNLPALVLWNKSRGDHHGFSTTGIGLRADLRGYLSHYGGFTAEACRGPRGDGRGGSRS